jgi:predicted nucleic acid-binding protein
MKKIVVNDTNVFIDLYEVGLLDEFFSLPWEVHTTDFVMLELLKEGQHDTVARYKAEKRLIVPVFEAKEMLEIGNLFQQSLNKTNLSLTDCSVWYYAKKTGGRLLTGDGKLRKSAEGDNVKVSGILYIFDNLVEYEILDKKKAADLLEKLMQINMRLPRGECEKRILIWRNC